MVYNSDRMPPLNALRAFEAAARLLSFTKAADELLVTPGAISQQIRLLEEYIGTPLFRRTGREVLLTDPAHAALPMVISAFEQLTEAARLMRAPTRRGRVMVSCAPSFAAKWLAPRLENFHQAHQDIEVWVSADMGLTDFSSIEIDLALRYGHGVYEGVKAEKLLDEMVLPVCAPALLEGDKPIQHAVDLANHNLLHDESPDQDPSCPDWASWLSARNIPSHNARRGARFNQAALVIEAAALSQGVALAKRAIAQSDLDSGRLVAPFADGSTAIDFAYWIIWPKGRTQSVEARAFIKWIKAEAQNSEIVGV